MNVKIRKVKSPLKKYKRIIDEVQGLKGENVKNNHNMKVIGLIQQAVITNGLNQDILCDVLGCTPNVYCKFFLDSLDDNMYDYLLKQFFILFRCQGSDFKKITYVPKWVDNYWRMKCYMNYNRMILFFRKIWGFNEDLD